MIITIDGPAGSGKSSTAKIVAQKKGWHYLDSGSLYRTYALLFIRYGKQMDELIENMSTHSIELDVDGEQVKTLLDGKDVGDSIRTQEVSEQVSMVAAQPEIREEVNRIMRKIVEKHNFIADGRDLGSVVFPDAAVKFFMIADIHERARRRFDELTQKGLNASLSDIKKNLQKRDEQDSNRSIAPLIKPLGAIEIDTTGMSFSEQVSYIIQEIDKIV